MPSPPTIVSAPVGPDPLTATRLPSPRKLAYGIGNVAYSLPYQATASLFMLFATAILGIRPAVAGLIGALSIAWDALTDPVVGYLSDNTEGRRLGRRHPYILAGGLAIALFNYLLWTISPTASLAVRVGLVVLSLLLLKSALAVFFVPYLALGGELTQDYDQRSSIQGIRAVFYLLGMILALFAIPVFFFRSSPGFPRGQLNPAAYPRMALASTLVAAAATLICFVGTRRSIPMLPKRSEEMRRQPRSAGNVWRNFLAALKNRELRLLVLMIFVLEAGFQFGIAIGFHVNTYTYGMTGPMIGTLGLVVLGTSVLSQPLWVAFTKRFEKKTALIAGLAIGFFGFIGAPWTHVWWKLFPIQAPTLPFTLGFFFVLAGIGNGAFMSIPNSMIADAADVEEVATGKRDEGLYFGTYTLAYKAGTAVSWALSGLALTAIGFIPGSATQSDKVQFGLAMAPTYLLLVTAPFALYFILRYGITRERWRQTRALLDSRRRSGA